MRKTTIGAAVIASALVASLTLASGGTATATTVGSTAAHPTASQKGLSTTSVPVLVDPAADLTYDPDQPNQSWYITAHVTSGGHRYGFLAHYLNSSFGEQQGAISRVSVVNEDTGWYTKSEIPLPAGKGLSDKQGIDIHTDNITWTGLRRDVPLAQQTPAPQALDQVPHRVQIRRRGEQGQPEHEVHHQPGRQQPSALLRTTARGHHTIHQPGRITQVSSPKPDNSPTPADTRTTPGSTAQQRAPTSCCNGIGFLACPGV
jgi:hypothetical protein